MSIKQFFIEISCSNSDVLTAVLTKCEVDLHFHKNNNLISCDLSGKRCGNSLTKTEAFVNGKGCITGITIDVKNGKISWMETENGKIFSGEIEHFYDDDQDNSSENVDGKIVWTEKIINTIVISHSPNPSGLVYLRNHLIWISGDQQHAFIQDITKPDSVKTIPLDDKVKYTSIVTADKDVHSTVHDSICTSEKPFCSDICVTSTKGERRCLCPQGHALRYGYLCMKEMANNLHYSALHLHKFVTKVEPTPSNSTHMQVSPHPTQPTCKSDHIQLSPMHLNLINLKLI
ncbi:hypothetical protein HELRODRAFT_165051 [Helobdella robusta]|uniref:EGF-like domain-containing protein n=1 Tax=Helobdella robusta TaxID=6412 RepID=T1EW74_HELRO|nr:hypothetical protein HELRODRAFT_165051 [Helobdella robusta]ESN92915.1 hypothetical protein HELRODRAFT_165051 [Helobdella robusta]